MIVYYVLLIFVLIMVLLSTIIVVLKMKKHILESTKPTKVNRLLCFSGGGIAAMSADAAVIGGVIGRLNKGSGKIRLRDYLNKYDIMSGVSGGSWFMSAVTYSKIFHDMIDREADGKNMFFDGINDCYTTTPLDIPSGKCSGVGVSNCQYNDETRCCCDIGFSPTKGNTDCEVCGIEGLTMSSYIKTMGYYGRIINSRNNPKLSDVFDVNNILDSIIPPSNRMILDIATTTTSFDEVLLYFLFGGLSDVNRSTKISDNPNGLTNAVIWNMNVMKSGHLAGKYGDIRMITYDVKTTTPNWCIGDDTTMNCGMIDIPLIMGYDFGKKTQLGSIYEGNLNATINYYMDAKPGTILTYSLTDKLKKVDITNESIVSLCSGSGSAIAIISSPEFIDDVIDYKVDPSYSKAIRYAEGGYCFFNTTNSICGISAYLSSRYNKYSPVFKANPLRSGFVCEGSDGICMDVTKQDYSTKWETGILEAELPVRLLDGGYSDNTGISSAISKFQKSGKTGICNIVSTLKGVGNIDTFAWLFNVSNDGTPVVNRNTNNVEWNREVPRKTPHIFHTDDFKSKREIYRSVPPTQNCGNGCVHLVIDSYSKVTTVENKRWGIEAGTECMLYNLTFHTTLSVFPFLDGWSGESDDYYDNSAIKQAKIIRDLMFEIPDDVFESVFGDEAP